MEPDLSDPIAELRISPARRYFSTAIQFILAFVLISLAFRLEESGPLPRLILTGFGLLCLWQGIKMHQATARKLVLTRAGLFDSSGAALARFDDIRSIDRGFFAFKPSNGFLIRLKDPAPRAWVPGVWWRYGTRVGIGGTTSGKAARDMADLMAIMLADPTVGENF